MHGKALQNTWESSAWKCPVQHLGETSVELSWFLLMATTLRNQSVSLVGVLTAKPWVTFVKLFH